MQSDNAVIVQGKVVRGPFVSYVNNDSTKMRVKYQVQVLPRKYDNFQTFMPWVRSLGNQAQRDHDNIKVGDIVTVSGRIVTRNETKRRYFVTSLTDEGQTTLTEVNPETDDDIDNYDNVIVFDDKRMVTEIRADDVRYFSVSLANMSEEEIKKLITPKTIDKVLEIKLKQSEVEAKRSDKEATDEDEDCIVGG